MATQRAPVGLGAGGRSLWRSVVEDHELDAPQRVMLEEACRAKDRLDKLDQLLRGDVDTWAKLVVDVQSDGRIFELRITQALSRANETANQMKQLLAALRLPDESGKRPQQRGGARGSYAPGGALGGGGHSAAAAAGKVSSLDRARAAKSGS